MTTQWREYLGDSVYAEFDGYHVILTTNNGYPDDPRNRIALEPSVLRALHHYEDRIRVAKENPSLWNSTPRKPSTD